MIRSVQNAVRIAVRNTWDTVQPSLVNRVSVRPVLAAMPLAPPRCTPLARCLTAPYFGHPTATVAHVFGQVSNRSWLSSRAVHFDSSPSAMAAPPKSKDPRDVPTSEALKLIAKLWRGRQFEVDLSRELAELQVNSLADVLNLSKDDLVLIKEGISDYREKRRTLNMLTKALSVLWQMLDKEGRPEELNSIQIGKTIRVLLSESRYGLRDRVLANQIVVCSTLQLESFLNMHETKHLKLLSPLEIGIDLVPHTYDQLVDGGVYTLGSSSLEDIGDLKWFIENEESVMGADVQQAVVAAKGPTAHALAPLHVKRHLQFKVLDPDPLSKTYKQLVDRHWEIHVLVSHDDCLTIGQCKHIIDPSLVSEFVARCNDLKKATERKEVKINGEPYTELLDKWPTDSAKLELVLAAAHGWDVPDPTGVTARMRAGELGVKVIERNGAEWLYAR